MRNIAIFNYNYIITHEPALAGLFIRLIINLVINIYINIVGIQASSFSASLHYFSIIINVQYIRYTLIIILIIKYLNIYIYT